MFVEYTCNPDPAARAPPINDKLHSDILYFTALGHGPILLFIVAAIVLFSPHVFENLNITLALPPTRPIDDQLHGGILYFTDGAHLPVSP